MLELIILVVDEIVYFSLIYCIYDVSVIIIIY